MAKSIEDAASKGMSGTALGLGIAGTALGLGLFNGGRGSLGGLFGGGCQDNCGRVAPTPYEVQQKECEDNIALTRAIYDMRIKDLEEKTGIYNYFNAKIADLDKRVFAIETEQPLRDALIASKFENENLRVQLSQCHFIKGYNVLPNTPVVTGYEGATCCGNSGTRVQ